MIFCFRIDTPGVIARVSELFRGYDHLILGFNRFLPEGYKISPQDIQKHSSLPQIINPTPVQPNTSFSNQLNPFQQKETVNETMPQLEVQQPTIPVEVSSKETSPIEPPSEIDKQPELDHARNYVKKIKVRFEHQPDIYKAFLRILHTFHEERHTLKDVYDKVADLFKDHDDLLFEFKQFLPDKTLETPSRGSRRLKVCISKFNLF